VGLVIVENFNARRPQQELEFSDLKFLLAGESPPMKNNKLTSFIRKRNSNQPLTPDKLCSF